MNGEASIDDSEDSINPIAMFSHCRRVKTPMISGSRFDFDSRRKATASKSCSWHWRTTVENPAFFFYIKLPHPRASRASRASWDFMDNHGYHLFCANGSISIHIDPISESLLFGTLFLVIIKVLTVSGLEGPGPRASRNQRSLRLEDYFV